MMDNRQVFSHFTFFASLALMAALMFSPATLANTSDAAILDALNRTSDPEATLKWYVSSEADLDTISDPEDRAEAYHLLGRAYYQVGNSIQAQSMLAQAIELIGDRPDNAAFAASAFNDMGLVLVSRANLKDALLYFESAQDRAIAAGAPEAIVLSGINLVRTLLANANHQKLPILLARIKTNLDESTPSLSVWPAFTKGSSR
jgi:tetratricopeptide (TPR) repeat protein